MNIKTALVNFALVVSAISTTPKPKGKYIVANVRLFMPAHSRSLAESVSRPCHTGFATSSSGLSGTQVTGLAPHSPPNRIVSGIQQTAALDGSPGFSVKGTTSKSFDLKSFWFGCVINTTTGVVGLAQQCTISVRGYRKLKDANPVASAQFSFQRPATKTLADMIKATFDASFKDLQRVDVAQIESTSGEALNVVVLDDVAYDLYK